MAITETLWSGLITSLVTNDSITLALVDGSGRSGKLNLARYRELALFVDLVTFTAASGSPTIQILISTANGEAPSPGRQKFYNLYSSPAWTGANSDYFTTIGPGCEQNHSLGVLGRINWNVGGSGSVATCTFWVDLFGKL